MNRRKFFAASTGIVASAALTGCKSLSLPGPEPVIDIHQHTHYSGRTDADLIAHQRTMGVTHTILLPAGRFFGLEADCHGNASVLRLTQERPRLFSFFANEVPYLNEAEREITQYLKRGAIGIGEQKFQVDCDSADMERMYAIAADFGVPVLMHFQHDKYNTGIERFHKVLEKYPRVNFIGHAQTWWANIDRNHIDQKVLYPKTPVLAGGLTDRYLRDYPNMYADMSAGSGLNALLRDEAHARAFLARHQDKLLYGSDCNDSTGKAPSCQGAMTIATIRRLAPSKAIERKVLYENSKRLFNL